MASPTSSSWPARWGALHPRVVAQAAALLPVTSVLLRALGYGATRRLYARAAAAFAPRAVAADDPRRIARSVDAIAMRYAPARTCLARALVLELALRRRGFRPELRFGARRAGDGIAAHAWVELDGVVLGRVPAYEPLEPAP